MSWLSALPSSYYEDGQGAVVTLLVARVERPKTGETYGPFEVLERLGVGGMATVHRAIERGIEGFEREVALKRLLPHLAEDEDFLRLFVREAKLASLLQHGNIVQLHELGRVGPSYFISMEYIAGRDLRAAIRQARRVVGPPPLEITLQILSELLDALDYAHNRRDDAGEPLGLVHRDISPSNLLIAETGHLKVIDFGVAKATQGQLQSQTGGLKGKLSYMPPEMLAGRPLDGRSDLFSASVIAHELITTAPLFTGDSEFQTMDRIQRMVPAPPSARNRDCPPELDAIVLKGLEKEPDQRWSSAAEMRTALAEVALRFRLHATSRDVAGWIAWAFGRGASRRPLPLAPPEATSSERSESESDSGDRSPVELDERDFEAAWDWLRGSAAAPVLLADVPDVSGRAVRRPALLESEKFPRLEPPEPDDDAPTMAVELLPDADVLALFESGPYTLAAARADSVAGQAESGPYTLADPPRADSVLPVTGPDSGPVGAIAWAEGFVAATSTPESVPTVSLGPAFLAPRAPDHIAPAEWADGTEPDSKAPLRELLAPAVALPATLPLPPRTPNAPITLGEPLGAPLGRWRVQDPAEVRIRPSAGRAFFIFLIASMAITAATAYILRGDRPPPRKTGPAAPPVAARQPAPAATPTPPAVPAAVDQPALVPPDRVKLRRGQPPVLRTSQTGATPAVIDAELCVDRRGQVASVKIHTPVSIAARAALTAQLGRWRYHPIEQDGHRVAGCFAAQVRPTFE